VPINFTQPDIIELRAKKEKPGTLPGFFVLYTGLILVGPDMDPNLYLLF
jgi:hypothetical protein